MTTSRRWPYPGARWWKMDFHAHTPYSSDTAWHRANATPDELTPEKWLLKFMEAGLDCVAITDHNGGGWIDTLKSAYASMAAAGAPGFRELTLFPGVELSVSGGFHLIALFDPSATTSDVDTLLGKVDYDGTKGDSDGVTGKSPVQVIDAVLAAGALPIPAHADQDKGLLRLRDERARSPALDANTLRQVLNRRGVLAMEWIDRAATRPSICDEGSVRWTEVLGSDCHSFRGEKIPGSRFTWVKMAEPSAEGLRLALLDGQGFSIRRSDSPEPFEPNSLPEHFIQSIEIVNARYMGRGTAQTLRFAPWFNALIGGRGTGKSTVVHSLRLAYRRESELTMLPETNEARRTFERFAKPPKSRAEEGGLNQKPETRITVSVTRDAVRHRLHWSQEGKGVAVEEETGGTWRPSTGQSVTPERFPLRIFSQGQIAALAGESQEALLRVIDEPARTSTARAEHDEVQRRFLATRALIRDIEGRLNGREQVQVGLEDVRRKLDSFEGKQHAEVLKEYQHRKRQAVEVKRHLDGATDAAARVEQFVAELVPVALQEGLFDQAIESEREILAVIERLRVAVQDAARSLRQTSATLQSLATKENNALPQSAWGAIERAAIASYEALTESLKGQGVSDPSEYGNLVQERQRLEGEAERFQLLEKQRLDLIAVAEKQRLGVREARRAVCQARQAFLTNALTANPFVRIELLPYGRDSRAVERSLREVIGAVDDRFPEDILTIEDDTPKRGMVADLLEGLPADTATASQMIESRLDVLAKRVEAACSGGGDFGGHFKNFLLRECQKHPELLDRVLIWSPEDALRVEYSQRGDGKDFKSIGQASAGQRAAAMLAFLLAHGTEPLVLDQPEDDLDNHLIYDLVVRQIRENKARRQIIVVTHNPNIVVNGDAENLHALDFLGGQCRVVKNGSLQDGKMRDEVCRVMEGGREAFLRRFERLGRDISESSAARGNRG